MKRNPILLALVLLFNAWFISKASALTVEDIINMSNIGVSDSVLIQAIEVSESPLHLTVNDVVDLTTSKVHVAVILSAIGASDAVFRLTPNEIITLTQAGVGQDIIAAMQKTSQAVPAPQPEPASPGVAPTPPPTVAPPPTQPASQPTSPRATSTPQGRTTAAVKPFVASDRPHPAEVKELKRRYDGGRYVSAALTAFDLLTGANKDRFIDSRSTIMYYLGKSLFKMGFYHSAHVIFLRVAKEGPSVPNYIGCLSNLTATSNILRDYSALTRLLQGVPSGTLNSKVKNAKLYLNGLDAYLKAEYSDAEKTLGNVSGDNPAFAKAQFIRAMALYEMDRKKEAVATFRRLVESKRLQGDPEEINDIRELALLNMARIYYEGVRFDVAEKLYELVPRESHYWPQSLFEAAYADFWQAEDNPTSYNVALGRLLTLDSPFFKGQYYLPEAKILEALIYFNLCEYDRVEDIVRNYQGYVTPVRDAIRAFRKAHGSALKGEWDAFHADSVAMEAARNAYVRVYETSPPGQSLGITQDVIQSVESQRDFKNVHHHLGMIQSELELLNSGKTKWKGTDLGRTLKNQLEGDALKLRADAGRHLLVQLSHAEVDLSHLLRQSEIIYLEVVKAQKEEYEDKFQNPEYVETYDEIEQSYATNSRLIFWPFTGEFWKDELGYYRFTERGSCRKK